MAGAPVSAILRHIQRLADPPADQTDGQLLQRFVGQRDEAAFAALLRRHGRLVWSVCRHRLYHEQDAEDAFQATFLVLARRASAIRKMGSVASWLHGVAYRIARKAVTMNANRRRREHQSAATEVQPPPADLAVRELQALLDEELERLPAKCRAAFILCCLEGRSRKEAAVELGWKEGTLSCRIAQARRLLQERLTRRGVTLSAALTAGLLWGQPASAALLDSARKAVSLVAAGRPLSEATTGAVATLVQNSLRAVTSARAKLALVLALLGIVSGGLGLASGVGILLRQPADERPVEEKPEQSGAASRTNSHGNPLPAGVVARLGTARFRHGGGVDCIVYSPDGKILATGGSDEVIRLWDAATGLPLRVLQDHQGHVHALAFSSDGKWLASAGDDTRFHVRVWETATGKVLHTFQGGGSRVAFAPDDRRLVSAGPDENAHWWDLTTGQELPHGLGKHGMAVAVTFSKQGKALVASQQGETITIRDLEQGKEIASFPVGKEQVLCAAFSPDATKLALGGARAGKIDARTFGIIGTLRLVEVASGKLLHNFELEEKDGGIRGVAFSADGQLIAAGSDDRVLRLWDAVTGTHVRRLHGRGKGLANGHPVAFSPDGRTVAGGGTIAQGVQLWSVASGKLLHEELEAHQAALRAVAVSRDGKRIASGSEDASLRVWDAATGKPLWQHVSERWNYAVAFSPDGNMVAAGADDQTLRLFDAATGKERQRFKIDASDVYSLAFTPDGTTLAVGLVNWQAQGGGAGKLAKPNRIQLWDVASGQERWQAKSPDGIFCHVDFSPDGKKLFSAHADKFIRTWDAATGKPLSDFEITGHRPWLHAVAFSPDGRFAATNGFDGNVLVWDMTTGKQVHLFHIGAGFGYRLAFSPDSRYLAAGAEWVWRPTKRFDMRLHVWELTSGKEALTFDLPPGCPVSAMAFWPDGDKLVTGMRDTTLLIWDLTRPLTGESAKARSFDELWSDLASADAAQAHRAIVALRGRGEPAVTYLKDHLAPGTAPDGKRVEKLIADLDSEQFAVRDAAAKELGRRGEAVEPLLRRALDGQPSPEARKRLEALVAGLADLPTGERLRALRAIQVLEYVGTPAARALLHKLADGAPARPTREAKAALQRLQRQPATPWR
jgi:RNA polymerase sigma factor (sigma-70 family)